MCIITKTREFIRKDDLSSFDRSIKNQTNLLPLVLPLIKQHKHSFLKIVLASVGNPDVCIDERFGTTPKFEAGRCHDCLRVILEAEKNYQAALVISKKSNSPPRYENPADFAWDDEREDTQMTSQTGFLAKYENPADF